MPKDRIDWPEDKAEAYKTRSDRIAIIVDLRRKALDPVNKLLTDRQDYSVFRLVSILEACHPARIYIREYQPALKDLLERLKAEDYTDQVIENVKSNLGLGDEFDEEKFTAAMADVTISS